MKRGLLLFFAAIIIHSCIPLKDLKYVSKEDGVILNEDGYIATNKKDYIIRQGDELLVKILVDDPNFAKYFSVAYQQGTPSNMNANDPTPYLKGPVVDRSGYIELPLIGKFYVEGDTFFSIERKIKEGLLKIYKEEAVKSVKVDLGQYNMYVIQGDGTSKRITSDRQLDILEAIALAGGLPVTANREQVKILRKVNGGERLFEVDLNDMTLINQPEYYLENNDKIIIEPRKEKQWGLGTNALSNTLQLMSALMSMITFYLFIKNI